MTSRALAVACLLGLTALSACVEAPAAPPPAPAPVVVAPPPAGSGVVVTPPPAGSGAVVVQPRSY